MTVTAICLALIGQVSGLEVREIAATKGDPFSPFGTIGSMVEGAPGEVIISDDVQPALHLWKPGTDSSVEVLAREGRGPGEVRTPTALASRPSGGFALYDIGNAGVLLYDAGMRFERKVVLQGGFVSNPKSMAVLHDESFVLAGGRMRDPRHLHRYSASGEWLESFGGPPEELESPVARIQSAGGAVRATARGFLFSVGTPLRILRFPAAGLDSPDLVVEDLALLPELNESTAYGAPDPRFDGQRPYLWYHTIDGHFRAGRRTSAERSHTASSGRLRLGCLHRGGPTHRTTDRAACLSRVGPHS